MAETRSPEYLALVKQMLESQGFRELMAAHLFGHGVKFAPDLPRKRALAEHAVVELNHFAWCAEAYAALGGDLEAVVGRRLAREPDAIPYPQSWLELAVIEFTYHRSADVGLAEYLDCSYEPYRAVVRRVLADEGTGEEHFGAAAMEEASARPRERATAQELFNRWFAISLLSFGRPGTAKGRQAVEWGLKRREAQEVVRSFVDDLRPTLRRCGLAFPRPEDLGVELPAGLELRV